MSSLASSPPKSGGSPPINNWARMQAFQEAHMRHSSLEGGPAIGQGVGEGYTMAEMAHMRRAEMARSGVEKGRGMYGGEIRGPGGHYSSHMQQIPPGYRGHGDAGSYMRHMSADRDYATDMDEFGDFPVGMKLNSVSSAVREVATRMNEVRLGHNGHMMGGHQHMDEQMAAEYAQRTGSDLMVCMRERMPMGPAQMMRSHGHGGHDGKMQHPYGGGMLMNLGGHMGRGAMPFIAAQPPCLPFAMHGGGYGAGSVPGAGMGGAANSFDMMHRSAGPQAAKHNKYCHFCQHVKVRASGMLACCNKDCTRRFCEHCLSKSIGDDVNPQTSAAWVNGQWHCPVCRKLCCCAIGDCDKNHRHCKAYRYRVRRAEQQAVKRAGTTGGEGASPRDSPRAKSDGTASVKAEQAVEISEEEPAVAAVGEGAADAKSAAVAGVPVRSRNGGQAWSLDSGSSAQFSQGPRVKSEGAQREDSRVAASTSDTPSMPVPAAAFAQSPSSMGISPSMPHRLRQGRRGDVAGNGAPVDLNDVQTMADSWLRLLEEEEEELSGFMHGGEATSGMRGAKAGSESDGADSIEQRWRDIEGTPSFSEDQLASEGGAGRMGRAPFSRNISTLSHLGSSDSLHRIVAEDGGGMMPSMSSQSLSEFLQRDGDMLSRNVSRDNLMHDTLLRNVSDTSLTEMVRNYSSGSLEAVMEQSEGWVQAEADANHPYAGSKGSNKMRGGDFDFLQGGSEGRGQQSMHGGGMPSGEGRGAGADPDLSFLSVRGVGGAAGIHASAFHMQQASTGKRMHRTNSHNKLVHEAVTTVGRGMPRPPSHEKLSRQCGAQDEVDRLPTSKEDDEAA